MSEQFERRLDQCLSICFKAVILMSELHKESYASYHMIANVQELLAMMYMLICCVSSFVIEL